MTCLWLSSAGFLFLGVVTWLIPNGVSASSFFVALFLGMVAFGLQSVADRIGEEGDDPCPDRAA